MSIAYLQSTEGFVSRKVFPTVSVKKQSDLYYRYAKKQWFRTDAKVRAPGTESAGSGFDMDTNDNYFCPVIAIHKDVDDQLRANADSQLAPDRDATELVTRHLMLKQEKDWASKYFTTGVWAGAVGGLDITPGTLWDAANSTPIVDIREQIRSVHSKTGHKPNTLTLGAEVWDVLVDHPDFLERIKYTEKGVVTAELIAGLLGIDRVLVADAIEDTGVEGAAESLSYVFGKNALLTYSPPRPALMMPSAGYTFAWSGLLGANAAGMRMSRFRMEHLKSDRVEGEAAYDQKVVSAECGAFFSAVIS
jgi:hypothetical protein